MFEGEPVAWVTQVTGIGGIAVLLTLLWYSLASGKLLTRGQHESIVRLHEKAAEKDAATIAALQEQNKSLIEGNEITKDFFDKVTVRDEAGDTVPTRRKVSPRQGATT